MPLIVDPDADYPYPYPGPGYDFHERTVSRHLVHASAVSDVLITGWQATGPYDFLLGAQWPRLHGFYRLADDRHHDPVLMAETVRQAALLIGHVGFGVPRGDHFAIDELCYSLGPAGLEGLAVTAAPASLMLKVSCQDVRMRHGRPASLRVHAEIERDGRPVGHGSGELRVLSPVAYTRLRGPGLRPAGPRLPGAPTGMALTHPVPTAPELVGRERAADVVLGSSSGPDSWLLRVDPGHPVLFDPAADHVPGMLVLEAARQAAQRLRYPEPVVPVELQCSFDRFIELDRPCLVRAVRESCSDGRRVPVRVQLIQDGRTAAECRLLTEPARQEALDGCPSGRERGLPLAS
ncbi:ScbA/BarX family gamma-butyrolactone biosynthesis protein [Kitasatospora sp. NPDC091207]|uniref:ScbA/BarX family gamma-butyrolactone biosynthesis protein n=1 Tax=Kitasatospora sp. NPDC091207 TaxID=3364083 RepID=UPI0037FDD317